MSSKQTRRTCASILRDWEESTTFIDAIIDRHCMQAGLESRDRAFVQNITLGIIRNLTLLGTWIDRLRKGKIGSDEQRLLELGLFQILLMRVPDHAAVNETVELARPRARGMVNAVLRRAVRERDELLALTETLPPAQRYSMPEHIYTRWEQQFGVKPAEEIAANATAPAAITVRSNPLCGGLSKQDIEQSGAQPVDEHPGFYLVETLPIDALDCGRCYAQDPATALAPDLLAPKPGERVLDACAAPGGKSAILAATMENTGEIVAVDIAGPRSERLRENLRRLAVSNVRVETLDLLRDGEVLAEFRESFDRVLIDVPCSNTGVLRRRVDARWRLMPGFPAQMAELQSRLVRAVVPLLKPGGKLVYSTCSIEPEENSGVVAGIIEQFPLLQKLEEISLLPSSRHDGAYAALLGPFAGEGKLH
jgi:16S rRNA (cytosine967-C5)-methyltransferase